MIKVGVIGTGYIGGVHIEALKRIGGIKIVSITDINKDFAGQTAEKYNIEKVAADYKEMIQDTDVDVIHNCTSNRVHYEITKAALNEGKQVLSEKPLAMTLKEAEELVETAEKKNAVTGVDFCYRYYPVVQEMAVRIQRGDCGEVRLAAGTWFQDWLSKETDYTWRLEKSESGESNITADLGSHWFDLVQFTTGLKVKEVFGHFHTMIPQRKKPKRQVMAFEKIDDVETETIKIEVEDYSSVLFTLSNGAPGSFTTSQVCTGRKSETAFEIYGSECGYAWNHKRSDELWIGRRDKENEILIESPVLQDPTTARYASLPAGHPMGYHDAVMNLFKDYYTAVEKGGDSGTGLARPTFRTGYEEMKILDAILESVKKKPWAKVRD